MNKKIIIKKIRERVKKMLQGEATGHDWWHTFRVWKLAKKIGKKEGGDLFIIELASLLHDIQDWKFSKNKAVKVNLIQKWLKELRLDKNTIDHICDIIKNISFKGAGVKNKMKTIEGKIVQDADRLDATGAIGIARCFATGAKLNREIYNPEIKPKFHKTFREYKISKSTSINHFYEKLLLLKNLMNTKAAKKIAKERHEFMEKFLNRFFKEWEAKDFSGKF
ncbi:MAG: HD domain-containing protein [Minisyncoccia bacterium]